MSRKSFELENSYISGFYYEWQIDVSDGWHLSVGPWIHQPLWNTRKKIQRKCQTKQGIIPWRRCIVLTERQETAPWSPHQVSQTLSDFPDLSGKKMSNGKCTEFFTGHIKIWQVGADLLFSHIWECLLKVIADFVAYCCTLLCSLQPHSTAISLIQPFFLPLCLSCFLYKK